MESIEGIDNSVGLHNVLGDELLFKEILVMFYHDHNEDIIRLREAIENKDFANLKHIVHTLKGVSSSVGAMELYNKARQLDSAVNDNKSEVFDALFTELIPTFEQVMSSIKSHINTEQ